MQRSPRLPTGPPIVFNGTFDGNGKTVSGLVAISDAEGVGFFAWAQGTVKNLTVKDSYFNAKTNVGGIVGRIQEFTDEEKGIDLIRFLRVENCVNLGTVSISTEGKNAAQFGHLAGAITGTITNSIYLDGCAVNTVAPDTAPGAVGGEAKALADINSDATVKALGDAFAIVDGALTLKVVATAGQVESDEPEVTEPETTAPEVVEPETPKTGDGIVLYLVIAVLALAGTAIVTKKREN